MKKIEETYLDINTLSDFVGIVTNFNKKLVKNGFTRYEKLLFRGQSNINYSIIPSIGRNRKSNCGTSILNKERTLIELAKFKLPQIFKETFSPIELLAKLQHHGIPTRLLDVTENALVALYFACCSDEQNDGEVILFKNNDINIINYPIVNAIADTYMLIGEENIECKLESFYDKAKEKPYFLEQKKLFEFSNNPNASGAKQLIMCCETPYFIYAPITSQRQQAQQSRYILFPNEIVDYYFDKRAKAFTSNIKPIDKNDDCIVGLIKIPKEIKSQILTELKLFGISEETLFLDNVDIVCKNIKATVQDSLRDNFNIDI